MYFLTSQKGWSQGSHRPVNSAIQMNDHKLRRFPSFLPLYVSGPFISLLTAGNNSIQSQKYLTFVILFLRVRRIFTEAPRADFPSFFFSQLWVTVNP